MPEQPANPAPTSTPAPKKRRTPGLINAKYLDEIGLARELTAAARADGRPAPLAARLWDAAKVTAYETAATDLETAAGLAVGRTKARQLDTQEQDAARGELQDAIHPIRVAAKRQYRGENDAGRAAFFVNEPTNVSQERLIFIAGELLRKLSPGPGAAAPEATLASILPADLATLKAKRDAYIDRDDEQTDAQSKSKDAHRLADTQFDTLRALPIDLQLAADQAFPFYNEANRVIREDFQIPADRPAIE